MLSLRVLAAAGRGGRRGRAADRACSVLSSSPSGEAPLTAPIQVIFDRPVAGSLDRSVDPAAIFRIAPAVPGRAEWRDPVTLRFPAGGVRSRRAGATPSPSPTASAAMDGSRLAEPYSYTFTVTRARAAHRTAGERARTSPLPRLGRDLRAGLQRPARPEAMRELAYLDFDAELPGARHHPARARGQRADPDEDAPWQYREAGGLGARPRGGLAAPGRDADPGEAAAARLCRGAGAPAAIDAENTKPSYQVGLLDLRSLQLRGRGLCRRRRSAPRAGYGCVLHPGQGRRGRAAGHPPAGRGVFASPTPPRSRTPGIWRRSSRRIPPTPSWPTPALRDIFGQRLLGNPAAGFRTTGYAPLVEHEYGRMTVERAAFRTLAVQARERGYPHRHHRPCPARAHPRDAAVQPLEPGRQRPRRGAAGAPPAPG